MSTSKFTSRFRRRGEGEAPAADMAGTTAAAPAAVSAPPSETIVASDAAPVPEASSDAAAKTSQQTSQPSAQPPSRLVEVERPKARAEAPFAARSWSSQAYPAAAAALIVLALGAGYGIGKTHKADVSQSLASSKMLDAASADLRAAQGQIGQLTAELKSLRGSVEGLKGERDKSRGEILARQTQLSERVERAGAEKADRHEKPERVAERPERAEKVAAAAPVPPQKPVADVAHTGSIGEAKPVKAESRPDFDPRKTPLDGYVVRDYDEGFALVETRSGRFIDLAVGYMLPGVGRVEAIERRGRQWVVITQKGFIAER